MKDLSEGRGRLRLLSGLIVIFALLLIGKLFLLQIVHAKYWEGEANRQYVTPKGGQYDRGNIFFTQKNGEILSAATLETTFKVAIVPKNVENKDALYEKLSKIVEIDHNDFIKKASKITDPYEEIATRLSKEKADNITALKLPGVSLYEEKRRIYPGGDLGAHVLGFVGYKGDELAGRYGVERYYNDVLERTGAGENINFFAEVFADIKNNFFVRDDTQGDLILTIEPKVESELENKLANLSEKYHTDEVGGIIMDPMTGKIIAMAANPTFDINQFNKVGDVGIFSNPNVESVYEMGSVMKPLTMAAGIDTGVVTPTTTYLDKGMVTVNGEDIYNFDKRGRGMASMQDVLNQSLNTGMVYLAQKLGQDRVRDYLLSFGLGDRTEIDLPNEGANLVNNIKKSKQEIDYDSAAFGQGIAVTPISTARAFAALANGGFLVTPHIVDHIKYKDGNIYTPTYEVKKIAMKDSTTETITNMLVTVVDKALLGGSQKMEHYSIAAKTGTAQVAKTGGGGYYEDRHLHSFFGYFPAYNPKFLVFLYALNPKGVNYAAYSLTGPFSDMAKFLIDYYNVPPDR